jgi:hypothetical protein
MRERTYLFKNESANGFKSSKQRVRVLCCAKIKGEKRDLLVTGKLKFRYIVKVSEVAC